ncbi:PadR family transcriptional regulator [Salinibacterium sp. PAMC 21357]|uniref:PadR family transcriptional regulator n=1 Tax=Salinibacterium sp. PAMC 21357 TaxID=1112215 RepID=UPI000288BDE1|nr:helix-turn-helix transcriptional regulator [Salinibacterium sp. PAMC 21357]
MSIRHSLLSILAQGPCYGYQLRSEFDRRTGSTWSVNVGQIYNTLDRLVRDDLVAKTSAPVDSNTDSSQQTYYAITPAGKLEVDRWFDTPIDSYSVSRDELAIKLAIAVTLPGVDAYAVIERQRQTTRGVVGALSLTVEVREDARDASQLAEQFVTDSLYAHAEAELQWLDHVEAALTTAQSLGFADSFALNLTKPKRGRPATTAAASPND